MKASKAAAALGIAVSLGLAGCTQHAGTSPASPQATSRPPPPLPSTPATPSAPSLLSTPSAPAPSSTPADPASVIESFYAAINAHDYQRAWDLGGNHLGQSYADFAGGFADTAADVIGIDNVNGNEVDVHLHAVHTDGSTADYAGSYLVENGTITHGSLHLVATSAATRTPVPTTPVGPFGALNPDVTQSTIHSTICVPGWTATIRPPVDETEHLKRQQLAASSTADKDPSHYEEDHIIPLELGGAPSDPANLRPVPLSQARTDDQLENSLHRAVCDGSMTLTAAQSQIEQAKAAEALPRSARPGFRSHGVGLGKPSRWVAQRGERVPCLDGKGRQRQEPAHFSTLRSSMAKWPDPSPAGRPSTRMRLRLLSVPRSQIRHDCPDEAVCRHWPLHA